MCSDTVLVADCALSVKRWDLLRGDRTLMAQWADLEENASQPNPFMTSWGLPPALDAIEGAGAIRLARFVQDGCLSGVMPIHRRNFYYGRPIPHWQSWEHANAFCGAPLVRSGKEHVFWSELLNWCDSNAQGALFLHIKDLPKDGALYAALRDVAIRDDRPAAIVQHEKRALLQSNRSPGEYLAKSLTTKKRKELRRQRRRLREEGDLQFVRQRGPEELQQWTRQFLALENAGWKGAEGSALACSPATQRIFTETLAGAAQAGRLERIALTLDGHPIAMLANFLTPPGAFSYKTTFDQAYSRFSPGVLLQLENLALLEDTNIDWTDSCASADHPMIDSIWRERRTVVRVSIALGGQTRRLLARGIFSAEAGADGLGL